MYVTKFCVSLALGSAFFSVDGICRQAFPSGDRTYVRMLPSSLELTVYELATPVERKHFSFWLFQQKSRADHPWVCLGHMLINGLY